MAHRIPEELYHHLISSKFNFIPSGEYTVPSIYQLVREKWPSLCDDSELCDHEDDIHRPEWKHKVRLALDRFKSPNGNVQHRGHNKWAIGVHRGRVDRLPMPIKEAIEKQVSETTRAKYGQSGESEAHHMLKDLLSYSPETLGLPSNALSFEVEYQFPSKDAVDILFKYSDIWVGVEVKPKGASQEDIVRGIFQCIKYRALIEAIQRILELPPKAGCVLALGGVFPDELSPIADAMDITVVDGIS